METNKKQTAVEWLIQEIITYNKNGYEFHPKYEENIIQQAKEMEKQQIIDAYEQGEEDGYWHPENGYDKKFESKEQYYNETYDN